MSLEHAILGFLDYGPHSGYDLKKAFDASVRHFWPADQSQIYRTLGRLADRGWAEVEIIEQHDRPNRKVYHITAAGREELQRWLTTPLPPDVIRRASLVQVFFAGQLSDEQVLAVFEPWAERLRGALERFGRLPEEGSAYVRTARSPREVFFWGLTLEIGVKTVQAQLEWVESAIERIRDRRTPAG